MNTIYFCGYECIATVAKYGNGRIAIQLIDARDHDPIATATVNIPRVPLGPDEVIIKNYSENTGIEKPLIEAGIIGDKPLRYVQTGFVTVPVYRYWSV